MQVFKVRPRPSNCKYMSKGKQLNCQRNKGDENTRKLSFILNLHQQTDDRMVLQILLKTMRQPYEGQLY